MARNEIKLRRQLIDETTLERHRNYSQLLKQHEHDKRVKKTRQFFIYSFLIAAVVILLLLLVSYILVQLERKREQKHNGTVTTMVYEQRKSSVL
jgi:flagellar biosynthesis/type III secretory pathway M-ring protein FliF/YscJ